MGRRICSWIGFRGGRNRLLTCSLSTAVVISGGRFARPWPSRCSFARLAEEIIQLLRQRRLFLFSLATFSFRRVLARLLVFRGAKVVEKGGSTFFIGCQLVFWIGISGGSTGNCVGGSGIGRCGGVFVLFFSLWLNNS